MSPRSAPPPIAPAPASASAKPEPEKKAEGPKNHKARIKSLDEAFASHDAKKVAALYAEDAVVTRPGRESVEALGGLLQRWKCLCPVFLP